MSLEDFVIVIVFLYIVLFEIYWWQKYLYHFIFTLISTFILILQSFYVSKDIYHSIVNIFKVVNCFVLFPIVLLYLFQDHKNILFAKRSFLLSCLFSSILFMISNPVSLDHRISSYSGDPVMYSFLLGFAYIITLFSEKITFGNFSYLRPLILIFVVLQIFMTGSGSGVVILVISTTVKMTLIDRPFRFGNFAIKILILLMGSWAIWKTPISSLTKNRINAITNPTTHYDLTAGSGQSSLEARSLSIKYAWDAIWESPVLGHGFYSGDQVTGIGLQPHNFFILCWLTGGFLGLILSMIFFSKSLLDLKKFLFANSYLSVVITVTTWFGLLSASIFWDTAFFSCLYIAMYGEKKSLRGSVIKV